MKSFVYALAAFTTLVVIGLAIFVYQLVSAGMRITEHACAEYPTVGVMMDVVEYVEANHGDWPTSWEQLGETDKDIQDLVVIRFDVTSEEILADPGLIYEVIQPVTGPWRVYPHAERDLEYLRERIESMKDSQTTEE